MDGDETVHNASGPINRDGHIPTFDSLVARRTLLGLGAGIALGGCATSAPRLTWWALGTLGENAPVLLPAFHAATGIAVDVQALPWTGAHEKLLTGFAGNSLPDVMMLNSAWLPELALIGAIAPPPARSPLLADRVSGAVASVEIGGRAMAVPWTTDSWVQFYRRDLLAAEGYAAPPLAWAEWMRMARAIKRRHPERFATLHLLDWPEPLFAFAAQQGVPLLRDHATRGNFSSAGFRTALGFYKGIFDERLAPVTTGAEVGDTYLAWRRGRFAILPSNALSIGDLRRRTTLLPPDLWSVALTPGPRGTGPAMARGTSLAVSRTARDPVAAWALIRYLCDPAIQRRVYDITGDLPTRLRAWNDPGLRKDPVPATFASQVARSVAPPAVPEWERIVTEVQLVAEHMVRGDYGVETATLEMDKRVDRILEKRRWLADRGKAA